MLFVEGRWKCGIGALGGAQANRASFSVHAGQAAAFEMFITIR
jgi:hypothetical protein